MRSCAVICQYGARLTCFLLSTDITKNSVVVFLKWKKADSWCGNRNRNSKQTKHMLPNTLYLAPVFTARLFSFSLGSTQAGLTPSRRKRQRDTTRWQAAGKDRLSSDSLCCLGSSSLSGLTGLSMLLGRVEVPKDSYTVTFCCTCMASRVAMNDSRTSARDGKDLRMCYVLYKRRWIFLFSVSVSKESALIQIAACSVWFH